MSARLDIERKIEALEENLERHNGYVINAQTSFENSKIERDNVIEELRTWRIALKAITPKEPMR